MKTITSLRWMAWLFVALIIPAQAALRFNGTNDYVSLGAAPALGATNFTIECWFKRQGTGAATSTGSGGVNAIPLVTKGRAENEAGVTNMNYFVGFATNGLVTADFEDRGSGLNHPSTNTVAVSSNTWQHLAVTYQMSGTTGTWVTYLNGVPDKTNTFTGASTNVTTPEGGSIQHAALGSALTTAGSPAGYFNGSLEEVRIWNVARNKDQIATNKNLRLTSAPNLIGRWPLTETSGTIAFDTSGSGVNGKLTNSASTAVPAWTADTAFPVGVAATLGNTNEGTLTDGLWSGGAYINAGRFQATTNLTLTTIRARVAALTAGKYKCAIYSGTSAQPGTLLGSTAEVINPGDGWQTFPLTTSVTVTNNQFCWLAIWSDSDSAAAYFSDSTTGTLRWGQYNYGAWPTNIATPSGGTFNYCIYATAAAAPPPPIVTTTVLPSGTLNVAYTSTLTASDGTPPYTWSLASGSLPTGLSLNTNTGVIAGTPTAAGTFNFSARVRDNTGATNTSSSLAIVIAPSTPTGTNVLFNFTDAWRYQQTNNLDGTGWQLPGYNDSAWPAGPGILGQEDCGCLPQPIQTPLTLFTNRLAHYFRTHFTFTGNPADASLVFSNLVDNGAVFYLNGVEIQRLRMPAGTITDTTPASASVGDATNYDVFTLTGPALNNLVVGDNVLAVQVHQMNFTSSDVVFGSAVSVVTGGSVVGSGGLRFDGTNDYVTFGIAPSLGVSNFTVECWFKQEGPGKRANTGTGGIRALPLVTKGMAETEGGSVDCNWFFGVGTNLSGQNVLAADFEDYNNGLNHPVTGNTQVGSNVWVHGAVTYSVAGSNWVLYLNGVADTNLVISGPAGITNLNMLVPRFDSIQHAALGGSLRTAGVTNADSGFFAGSMDEVRIWNTVRSSNEIAANFTRQITNAPAGLIARWALDDATGFAATNSIAGAVNGTLTNGPVWTDGYPFPVPVNNPPGVPVVVTPTNGSGGVPTSTALQVTVADPDSETLTVTYYGRVAGGAAPGADFTLVALPDTQHYSAGINGGLPAMFTNQTQWIVTNRASRNIQYLAQLGDCVQNGDNGGNNAQWLVATNALYRLENPLTTQLPEGLPYGVAVGNHDQGPTGNGDPNGTSTFYNQFFGTNHFQGYDYYGGHYGANNDNHYDLFSASGLDFIVVYFEYDSAMTTNSPVIAWANGVLQANASRRAILVSHHIINSGSNATFGTQGQALYDGLKGNTNLFLLLSGHVSPEEGQRTDTYQGRTVWSVMTDYQGRSGGGNGWLRLYEFSPSNNVIRATTYSPWLSQSETDADSQFEIPYQMASANPFIALGTNLGVLSGTTNSLPWTNLNPGTTYEWYAAVSDGNTLITGPTQSFTTASNGPPVNQTPLASSQSLTNAEDVQLSITLTGSDPEGSNLLFAVTANPIHGLLSGSAPNLTYTPDPNFFGSDSLTFAVSDGSLTSAVATVAITITPVNDQPTAVSQILTNAEDIQLPITLTGTDLEAGPLNYTVLTNPVYGLLSGTAPNLIYTPTTNFNGSDTLSFVVSDGSLTSAVATVAITVTPINDPPTAASQVLTNAEDVPLPINLVGADPEAAPIIFTVIIGPVNGSLSGTPPNYIYTPNTNFHGSDSLSFVVTDGALASSVATVAITVTPVNDPPTAASQVLTNAEDTQLLITLAGTDPEAGPLSYTVLTNPVYGLLSGTAPNLIYTPTTNFNGSDSLTFAVSDGSLTSAVATVAITVTPVNDLPTAASQVLTNAEDIQLLITLTGTDLEAGPLNYTVLTNPVNGLLSGTAPNLIYTPTTNFNGSDSLSFVVSDGSLTSAVATVVITVTPINDPPTAASQSVQINAHGTTNLTLTATDPDGGALTYAIVTPPTHGTIASFIGSAGTLNYTGAHGYSGPDSFTFTANDGSDTSAPETVTINLVPLPATTITSLTKLPDGNRRITAQGAAGQLYHLQGKANLAALLWSTLATNTADGSGEVQFDDLGATNQMNHFYRIFTP